MSFLCHMMKEFCSPRGFLRIFHPSPLLEMGCLSLSLALSMWVNLSKPSKVVVGVAVGGAITLSDKTIAYSSLRTTQNCQSVVFY